MKLAKREISPEKMDELVNEYQHYQRKEKTRIMMHRVLMILGSAAFLVFMLFILPIGIASLQLSHTLGCLLFGFMSVAIIFLVGRKWKKKEKAINTPEDLENELRKIFPKTHA